MRRWIATVSLLVASLVLFQTTVAAADAPQKTPSPKKAPMTQPTSINASTNLAAALPAVPPAPQPAPGLETIYLAGGCFWGMEEILRKIPGVRETQSGYTGGWLPNPKYDDTHDSKSGHAESVKVVFDPKTLSLEELLEKWFFRMHDPTTLNRQGNDVGSQYRSAIYTFNETQKKTAESRPGSTPPASGAAPWSPKSPPRPFGILPRATIRSTSSKTRAATPATSCGTENATEFAQQARAASTRFKLVFLDSLVSLHR